MHRGTGVLVVGGGFLGSHLVAGLAAEGARVTVLTRTRPQGGARRASRVREPSSRTPPTPRPSSTRSRTSIMWCGAQAACSPPIPTSTPIADVRDALPPLLTMLEALRRRPQVGITFVSSGGTVYGNRTLLPVPEST